VDDHCWTRNLDKLGKLREDTTSSGTIKTTNGHMLTQEKEDMYYQ